MESDAWRLYEDPDGYYSLRIPHDWIIEHSTSLGRSYRHGQFVFEIPRSWMVCGPAPDANNHLRIMVSLTVLRDRPTVFRLAAAPTTPDAYGRYGKEFVLPQAPAPNTTLGGAPAYHDSETGGWEMDLPDACVALDYYRITPRYRSADDDETLTPEQQAVWARFTPLAEAVIASFKPGTQSGWRG